jgi:diacylglycerol kinase family enzyme
MGPVTWETWDAWVALAIGLAGGGWLAWWRARRTSRLEPLLSQPANRPLPRREARRRRRATRQLPPLAVVFNPTKPEVGRLRHIVEAEAAPRGWGEVLWLETTEESPGRDQARQALAAGASRVLAVGGDGTVRAVAEGMAGSGIPLGIVPLGTGNLFARNLGLPLADVPAMASVAMGQVLRTVDVGRMTAWDAESHPVIEDQVFLVIAGLGFDARMVRGTDPALKAKLGWPAYFLSGAANLKGPRVRARVTVDGRARNIAARSIMVGNCGRLPAGLILLPDAAVDDGLLDVALVDTRAGIAGWASLAGKVVLQGLGLRRPPATGSGRIMHCQGEGVHVESDVPHLLELDGELVGEAQAFSSRIEPGAIQVAVRHTGP